MSVPAFSTQSELFSTAGLTTRLFAEEDRYRLFGQLVYPPLAAARPALENCYCLENGRVAIEPVLMLGVSILQELDGVPDRQAVEMLRYHAGWNFALNRQLGDAVFHPTSLSNFRTRLEEHQQSALGFKTIWQALEEAGLVSRQSRQRLDSTQMFGRVAKMSRLDCVRESVRLALQELEEAVAAQGGPVFWIGLWERYVDSQVDYRAGAETLSRKLVEAGTDAWQLLEWLRKAEPAEWAKGEKVQLLRRVFGEQFQVVAGQPAPLDKEKTAVVAEEAPSASAALGSHPQPPAEGAVSGEAASSDQLELSAPVTPGIEPRGKGRLSSDRAQEPHEPDATCGIEGEGEKKREQVGFKIQVAETVSGAVLAPGEPTRNLVEEAPSTSVELASHQVPPAEGAARAEGAGSGQLELGALVPPRIEPKGKGQLSSDRVQNPHEPDATYGVKGEGEKKKEHVGYKIQVAETVSEAVLAPGEPTRNFIAGIVTHAAYQSDEAGAKLMDQEQAQMGMEKPLVKYVDGAYVSAEELVAAQAEGREIIGPAQPAPRKNGRFSAEDFQVRVEERRAVCPAGKESTQCSRLEEESTGKVNFRFEWSTQCHDCPLRSQCLGEGQRHRTLVVGEHHSALQARRQEQKTQPFQERMKHRNAIEGTQSELVRGHGLRRARSRGLGKVKLQNYFIAAACNVKRWIRREAWKLGQAVSVAAAQVQAATQS